MFLLTRVAQAKGNENIQDKEKEIFFHTIHYTIHTYILYCTYSTYYSTVVKIAAKNIVIATIIDGF